MVLAVRRDDPGAGEALSRLSGRSSCAPGCGRGSRRSTATSRLGGLPFIAHLLAVELEPAEREQLNGLAPDELAAGIRAAYCGWLDRLAVERPVVVAIEDLHDGDAASSHLLEEILELTDRAPVMIVVSARPETDSAAARFRAHAMTHFAHRCEELTVQPISEDAASRLLDLILPGIARPPLPPRACHPGRRQSAVPGRDGAGPRVGGAAAAYPDDNRGHPADATDAGGAACCADRPPWPRGAGARPAGGDHRPALLGDAAHAGRRPGAIRHWPPRATAFRRCPRTAPLPRARVQLPTRAAAAGGPGDTDARTSRGAVRTSRRSVRGGVHRLAGRPDGGARSLPCAERQPPARTRRPGAGG